MGFSPGGQQAPCGSLFGCMLACNFERFSTSNGYCFGNQAYHSYMDDHTKLTPFLVGDADPVPASLFSAYPEQARTLTLLYEVSREITSILDREELLAPRRAARQKTRQLPRFQRHALERKDSQLLESAFAMRYGDTISVAPAPPAAPGPHRHRRRRAPRPPRQRHPRGSALHQVRRRL